MASAATSTPNALPTRVTRTTARRGGQSRLQQEQQDDDAGAVVSWCDFPSDLYGHILRRLPSCIDRVRLGAVCRHWRACARQDVPRVCQVLPMRVTRTPRGTHVVSVRGFSRLLERQCGGGGGFVDSPAFAVGGVHWAIRYYPGSGDGDDKGHVVASVVLLTEGAVAWAYVGLLLVDQTTGLADTTVVWDEHYQTQFDAAGSCCASMGTPGGGNLGTRGELKGSRFVRGDCLKIECVLDDVFREGTLK